MTSCRLPPFISPTLPGIHASVERGVPVRLYDSHDSLRCPQTLFIRITSELTFSSVHTYLSRVIILIPNGSVPWVCRNLSTAGAFFSVFQVSPDARCKLQSYGVAHTLTYMRSPAAIKYLGFGRDDLALCAHTSAIIPATSLTVTRDGCAACTDA